MKTTMRMGLCALLVGMLSSLYSCDRKEVAIVQPQMQEAQDKLTARLEGLTGKEARQEWEKFVTDVRQGRAIDPLGQYVQDGTFVKDDGKTVRPHRVKIDATERGLDLTVTEALDQPGDASREPPIDPCGAYIGIPCPNEPAPYPTFVSSQGVAPYSGASNGGDILDLKIIKGSNDTQANQQRLDGYTVLPIDLNYGTGGQKIYPTFTRNPNKVQLGDESGRTDRVIYGAVRSLYSFTMPFGSPSPWTEPEQIPLQSPGPFFNTWKHPDLNDGAGGPYIYGYIVKAPSEGPPIEVGVLRGSSSSVQPPSGWTKVGGNSNLFDLNEGAGGDYIYFCYKPR